MSQMCLVSTESLVYPHLQRVSKHHCCRYPADTLSNNDVVITSKRRHFDVITAKWRRSFWRYNDVIITSCVQWVNVWYMGRGQRVRMMLHSKPKAVMMPNVSSLAPCLSWWQPPVEHQRRQSLYHDNSEFSVSKRNGKGIELTWKTCS